MWHWGYLQFVPAELHRIIIQIVYFEVLLETRTSLGNLEVM